MEERKKVICIVGPTASGKTSLGIKLAKKIDGEVISADSMQVYKELNIGTAKVTKEEMKEIKHHMIDVCNIDEKFSVAEYKKMCYEKINELLKKGKTPIIVGGTGLYVNSVVYNMQFDDMQVDEEYRVYLEKIAQEKGVDYLHEMLMKVDMKSAVSIHKNNVKRVIRALEIANFSSKIKSQHIDEEKIKRQQESSKYRFIVFCIDTPRDMLYSRIDNRVDDMMKSGLLNEAKFVFDKKLDNSFTCMQAIGYKEFFPYFRNEKELSDCVEELKRGTKKYAKRQMTWFRNKLECNYVNGSLPVDDMLNVLLEKI